MARKDIRDILTPTWLQNVFLYGVDLTDDDGEHFPEMMWENCLQVAIETLEEALDIKLRPYIVENERHTSYQDHHEGWWQMRARHRPIRSVNDVSLNYGNRNIGSIDKSWVSVQSRKGGDLHIIPTGGSISIHQGWGGHFLSGQTLYGSRNNLPGLFSLNYTAGFSVEGDLEEFADGEDEIQVVFDEPFADPNYKINAGWMENEGEAGAPRFLNKTREGFTIKLKSAPGAGGASLQWYATDIPHTMTQAIGYMAALLPLHTAGDLIAGAGIASQSISLDGLSTSINTTSSATNSGYGARVIAYKKELDALLKNLSRQWMRPHVSVR